MPRAIDLTGQRFGRLVCLRLAEEQPANTRGRLWLCHCDCGQDVRVHLNSLRSGNTRSCGCYMRRRYEDGSKPRARNTYT